MFAFPFLGGGWMFGRNGQKGQPYVGGGLGLGFPIGLASEDKPDVGPSISCARFASDDGSADNLLNEMEAEAPKQSIETPGIGGPT